MNQHHYFDNFVAKLRSERFKASLKKWAWRLFGGTCVFLFWCLLAYTAMHQG